MTILFQYLVNPFRQLSELSPSLTIWQSIMSIIFFSLYIAFSFSVLTLNMVVVITLFMLLIMVVGVAIIDFFAQWLSCNAGGRVLFKWLALSMSLWIFLTPIDMLVGVLPTFLIGLLYMLFYIFFLKVQLQTIKKIYHIGYLKSIALLLIPGTITMGVFITLVVGVVSI